MSVQLVVHHAANAAYVKLSETAVARSVEVGGDIVVDLDEMDVVAGIEMLDLDAEIPFQRLIDDFHVRSDVVEAVRLLRPSISGFLSLHVAAEGAPLQAQGRTFAGHS